jgi:hypothetical protein
MMDQQDRERGMGMILAPWIVVARAKGQVVACSFHFTRAWADRNAEAFIRSCKVASRVTADVYSLPELIEAWKIREQDKQAADVAELERMSSL